jgi:hypothetical protein
MGITGCLGRDAIWQSVVQEGLCCECHLWQQGLDHGETERRPKCNNHSLRRLGHCCRSCRPGPSGWKPLLFVIDGSREPRPITSQERGICPNPESSGGKNADSICSAWSTVPESSEICRAQSALKKEKRSRACMPLSCFTVSMQEEFWQKAPSVGAISEENKR